MVKHVQVHISKSLSEQEWKVLRLFCDKGKRLATTKLFSEDGAEIKAEIRYEQDKGVWFESELPPEEEIAEFLMAFRFFYLQKERIHFPKILGLIGKHTDNQEVRKALKQFGRQWNDSLFGKVMNIKLNGRPITSSLLLDLWFNAHYFHTDEEKESKLNKLKNVFSEEFAKYMLLDAAIEASRVVFKVYNGFREIVNEHFNT